MSETAGQYLNGLLATYTPAASAFDAARSHRSGIESRLDAWLGVHEMFETGSLKHGTGVRWYSDADFVVSLKGERPSSTTALNKVKIALQDRYPNTDIQIRRPAVVCDFANGAETVEIVPAFRAAGGGYSIPDPKSGTWMDSHPKDHNTYVNEVNKAHSGAAKKLARLAKTWKYERNVPISSCYLEMRAAKYVAGESYIDLTIDLYYFLSQLEYMDLSAMNDPTGLGSRFNPCSTDSYKAESLSKLERAVGRAEKAKDFASSGSHSLAVQQLKLLFNQ